MSGVRILITDEKAIKNNDYIPEYIETIIIYGYIYENNKREIERLILELKKGNVLILAIKKEEDDKKILKLIKKTEINMNVVDNNGETALSCACYKNMPTVAIKLIDRMSDEAINKWDNKGYTALYWACLQNMPDVAIKLVERMNDDAINKWDDDGETALYWACYYNDMTDVAIKLIDRMSVEAINKWNDEGETALYMACYNKMTDVALKLIERMSIKAINKNKEKILNLIKKYHMKEIEKKLKEIKTDL